MGVVIVAAIVAVTVVGVVLSRMSSQRKKEAIASLEQEREAVGSMSILDLVTQEVDDLDLRSIDGAEGVPPDALLKAWSDADDEVRESDRSSLRFETAPGTDPGEARPGDVTLVDRTRRGA